MEMTLTLSERLVPADPFQAFHECISNSHWEDGRRQSSNQAPAVSSSKAIMSPFIADGKAEAAAEDESCYEEGHGVT